MSTKETVSDIVGKDLAYEERTRQNTIINTAIGTVVAGAGAANWGPEGIALKISDFESTYGTPLTRDDGSLDYTGLMISKVLEVAPFAYFTRVADSSAQKASLTINKPAIFASLKGESKISGKNYALTAQDVNFGFKFKNGSYQEAKVSLTPSSSVKLAAGSEGAAIFDNIDVTTNSTDGFAALSAGDLIKIEIDGILKQHIVESTDLFARLLDVNAGYLYNQANGGVGTSTPGSVILQFKDDVKFNVADTNTALSSILDNRNYVVKTGTEITIVPGNDATFPADGQYQMYFSMIINSDDPLVYDTFSQIRIDIDFSLAEKQFTSVDGLVTLIRRQVSTKYGTTYENLPITINNVGNKVEFATKTKGTHTLTFANTEFVNGSAIRSLGEYLGFGLPATGGSAISSNGDPINLYKAIIQVQSVEVPGSPVVAQTCNITLNPYAHKRMKQVLDGLNAAFVAQNVDAIASFVVTGTIVTGIKISTKFNGENNTVKVKNDTTGGAKALFTLNSLTNGPGIDVFNTEKPNGYLNNDTAGSAGAGDINNYVDRLAVAIKKHMLTGLPVVGGSVDDSMTVDNCPYIDIKAVNGKYGIDFVSQKIGADSTIKIYNFPVLYPMASINAVVVSGSNKTIASIVNELNTLITPYGFGAVLSSDGKLIIQSNSAGENYGINIISDSSSSVNKSSTKLLQILGIKDSSLGIDITSKNFEGANAKLDLGTFKAKYTGSEGNNVKLVKTTIDNQNVIQVWFKNILQDTFYNYTFDATDDDFLNTLIANSANASKIVEFIIPESGVMEDFADGIYVLSGGTSGIIVDEHEYIEALEAYKDIEKYHFDILEVSNVSTPAIVAKIDEVCKFRKDCFSIIDPPETVAGRINGIAVGGEDDMIRWHNGQKTIDDIGTKSVKLDSKYLTTYFPWLLTNTPSVKNPKQWHAPSVEVIPAIANCDLMAGDKTTPPAGEYTKMINVEELAHTIKNKGRLYDDKIGNNINPIVFTSKYGFIIDGQKTTQRAKNKYSRIHVMRIGLHIKRKIFEIAPDFFWKPVTTNTRNDFKTALNDNLMKPLADKSKIKGNYTINVEEYNDIEIEADNGMIAAIEWTPIGAVEKIKVISTMYEDVVTVTFE